MQAWAEAQGAQFCPRCGTLLVFSDGGAVHCDKCSYACDIAELPALTVVTKSYPKPPAEWLVDFRNEGKKAAAVKRAKIREECPKCHAPEMEFYTMQLRSADEGQTVFYECFNPKCGHKYSVNT